MIKYIWLTCMLSSFVYGQSFDTFLQEALQKSPYLKSNALEIQRAEIEGEKLQRYANPRVDLEYSQFQTNNSAKDSGYRVALAQPLQLWGVSQDKKSYADAQKKDAQLNYALNKAQFIKELSLVYLNYVALKNFATLAQEEQKIAQQIYTISQERYKGGTIARGVVLQAQVDFELVEMKRQIQLIELQERYNTLLNFAGITQDVVLDGEYLFERKNNLSTSKNLQLLRYKAQQNLADADAQLNTNKVTSLDLNLAYEKEPDQDIYRFGISVPLAVFNTKDQERQLAKLQAKQSQILLSYTEKKLDFQTLSLEKKRELLLKLKTDNLKTLEHQKELLSMFEDAYKIAKTNFIALQNIKNNLIKTQESLIQTNIALQKNAIELNYLYGAYNE
jgi:cobalt-zinc-cadmium efflux system outer membrane protein